MIRQVPDTQIGETGPVSASTYQDSPLVQDFRQILLWPLRVMADQADGAHISKYWEPLEALGEGCPWQEVVDEFGDPENFQERHYNLHSARLMKLLPK